MKKKVKSKDNNINIVIENNIFSKNKDTKKKEEEPVDDEEGGGRQPSLEYVAQFTPEPSFMSDIRQAFRDKNMYGFRYNTEPPQMYNPQGQPVYNHYFNTQTPQPQYEYEEEEEEEEEAATAAAAPQQVQKLFDENGNYLLPANTNEEKKQKAALTKRRNEYIMGIKKPRRQTAIKFGVEFVLD